MRTGFCIVLFCATAFAQDTTTATLSISGAGYTAPVDVFKAAPGQVLSVWVQGLDHRLDTPVLATGTPLPYTLAGISVTFQQGSLKLSVPLLGISQTPCEFPNAFAGLCESETMIALQMPFEVIPDCPMCGRLTIPAFLVISEGGTPKGFIMTAQPADNIHITDACDSTARLGRSDAVACGKIVTHADGTQVDFTRPAQAGETLVMYAFGLGRTTPLVASGTATPAPPPQLPPDSFGLRFTYTPPIPGPYGVAFPVAHPVYVGLVAGFVGLYQVNFVVPVMPPGPVPLAVCDGNASFNMTVTLSTTLSSDSAPICVTW